MPPVEAASVLAVASLSELAATRGTEGVAAIVAGHARVGDGGGGLFAWDARKLNADGGRAIASTGGGTWIRVAPTAAVDVRWFGATGDGITDDAPAVMRAIEAAGSGVVFFGPGRFFLSKLELIGRKGLRLQGATRYATQLIGPDVVTPWITVKNCDLVEVQGFELSLQSLSSATSAPYIRLERVETSKLEDLRLHGPHPAIDVGANCGGLYVRNVKVVPGATKVPGPVTSPWVLRLRAAQGVFLRDVDVNVGARWRLSEAMVCIESGCDTIYFSQCAFAQLGGSPGDPVGGDCVLLRGGPGEQSPRWVKFAQCAFESGGGTAIRIRDGNNVEFHDAYAVNGEHSVVVEGGSSLKFSGGVFAYNSREAFVLRGGADVALLAATIAASGLSKKAGYSGVRIELANRVQIRDCVIGDVTTIPGAVYALSAGIEIVGPPASEHHVTDNLFGPAAAVEVIAPLGRAAIRAGFVGEGSGPPNLASHGTFRRGDRMYNHAPQPGGFVGWICVKAGTPGDWRGFGRIESK